MNSRTRIYVIRHAQSRFNAGMDYSDLNASLTTLGHEQAKKTSEILKEIQFAAIYSSGLARTRETAEILKGDRKIEIIADNSTNERSIYQYARNINREDADLEEEILNKISSLSDKDKMNFKLTPEMESVNEASIRLVTFFKNIAQRYPGKNVLVVSHGNMMRSFLTYIGWSKYNELPTGAVKNAGYFVIETDGENFEVKETHDIEKQKNAIRVW